MNNEGMKPEEELRNQPRCIDSYKARKQPTANDLYAEFLEKVKEFNEMEKLHHKIFGTLIFITGLAFGGIAMNGYHNYQRMKFHHANWCVPKSFNAKPALQNSKAKGK
jgi:hypothetical protein